MFDNWSENLGESTPKAVFLALTLLALAWAGFKAYRDWSTYGTLSFLGTFTKLLGGAALAALVFQSISLSKPYVPEASVEMAFVLGNTANTPKPVLDDEVQAQLEESMLLQEGAESSEIIDSFSFVSATQNPVPIEIDQEKLRGIGLNKSNAERAARANVELINQELESAVAADHGSDYLEAIFLATDEVDPGANLVVIGSGLSDSGEFNFSSDNLLTSKKNRAKAIAKAIENHPDSPLRGYTVYFYGLGDTVSPQEPLRTKQKQIVRDAYEELIEGLGGRARIETESRSGPSVETSFRVSTSDTGCGDWEGNFRDDSVKFVDDQANLVDPAKAKSALAQVVRVYEKNPEAVSSISIDGYIADVRVGGSGPEDPNDLSGDRARAVRKMLIDMGIPAGKLRATGRGFGPNKSDDQNRMVRIAVDRNSDGCED